MSPVVEATDVSLILKLSVVNRFEVDTTWCVMRENLRAIFEFRPQ